MNPEELVGPDRAGQLFGAEVVDVDGETVGKVTEVFLDDETDQPKWVSIRTGWFGNNESLVPLRGAEISGDRIRVQYDKATIKDAPQSDDGQPLSREDESALYAHYEHESGGRPSGADSQDDGSHDDGSHDDGSMVRSEERLAVGTERVDAGRARLRRYLVTEDQQITVSVAREDVRVEYVTDASPDAAGLRQQSAPGDGTPAAAGAQGEESLDRHGARNEADADIGGREGWMVLYAQRPVVTMEWVPVERVRLGTVEVRAQETVSGEVRKEQLELVTDDARDGVPEAAGRQQVPG